MYKTKIYISSFIISSIVLFVAISLLTKCSNESDKSLKNTMSLILFNISSDMDKTNGSFLYDKRGSEYALYKMGVNIGHQNKERYQRQSVKSYLVPFDYDHNSHKVYNSIIMFVNIKDLCFEPDPDKAIVVFVSEKEKSSGKIFLITNNLCLYALYDDKEYNNKNLLTLLGANICDLQQNNNILLVKDEKLFMMRFISETNSNCKDCYGSWFCDALEHWKDIWSIQGSSP